MKFLYAIAAALAIQSTAWAVPVVQLQNVAMFPWDAPTTATFNVVLMNPDATAYQVSAFQYGLNLSPGTTTIQFIDAQAVANSTLVGPPMDYIFANSTVNDTAAVYTFDSFPNQAFVASDSESTLGGFYTLNPGDSVSLGSYTVDIPAGQPEFDVTSIGFHPLFTNLTMSNGALYGNFPGADFPLTAVGAGIANAPEPASIALFGITVTAGAVVYFFRRKRDEF